MYSNYCFLHTEKNLRKKLPYLPGIARQTLKVSLIHSRFYYFYLTLKNNKYSYSLWKVLKFTLHLGAFSRRLWEKRLYVRYHSCIHGRNHVPKHVKRCMWTTWPRVYISVIIRDFRSVSHVDSFECSRIVLQLIILSCKIKVKSKKGK